MIFFTYKLLMGINIQGVEHFCCLNKSSKESYRNYTISFPKLSAQVSWPSCKDERDENSFSIFSSNNVETKTCWSSMQDDLSRLPEWKKEVWNLSH